MRPPKQYIDHHFTNLLVRKSNITSEEAVSTIRNLSAALGDGHSCLRVEDADLITELAQLDCVTDFASPLSTEVRATELGPPELEAAQPNTPLVLVRIKNQADPHALLYTQRYFQFEQRIAGALISRNQQLTDDISALLPYLSSADDPRQQMAAIQAMTRQLVIISGGPGTGKTSTVVKCLAGLLSSEPELNIKLAAPTGKAAMRLGESIIQAAGKLPAPAPANMPTEVTTLHRLLGVRGDGHSFKHNRHNPIAADVLILDEASMIDLVMFDRVLQALPAEARLIILGDPAQLPSVDSGTVLADITAQGTCFTEPYKRFIESHCNVSLESSNSQHLLVDAHCELTTSFRFDDEAGIGRLASALRNHENIELKNNPQVQFHAIDELDPVLTEMGAMYQPYLDLCAGRADASALFDAFDQCRLLTPLREGDAGVIALNDDFEDAYFADTPNYYHGKPVMIMRNHYALRLFNGDIGICIQRGNAVEVAFKNTSGELEYYAPARLPQHETCYAMTVHKSQGSEFDQVLLLIPTMDREDFLSRELLYTGVTRTKSHLTIYYQGENLRQFSSHSRFTGLRLRFGSYDAQLEQL